MKIISCCLLSVLLFQVVLAQTYQGNNYVIIDADDDAATILRKAATVTPSPRQLSWQQLELTAFFHFGINSFTNKE